LTDLEVAAMVDETSRRAARRRFLHAASASGAWLALRGVFGTAPALAGEHPARGGFGELRPDPNQVLDLPAGFSYRVIARAGEALDDGWKMPGAPDGMAAFAAGDGRIALICNHELDPDDADAGPFAGGGPRPPAGRLYDAGHGSPGPGGTTTLIYNPGTRCVERRFLSLAGTERNCAGGTTPWGSWLSCEETVAVPDQRREQSHGWVFEVPARARELVDPVPLRGLGRFMHEAVAVDPRTGILYLTEDQEDGLLYRFLPAQRGRLTAGGRLQALALCDRSGADTRNRPGNDVLAAGQPMNACWIDLDRTDAPDDDLRARGHAAGAALFARGEGICFGDDSVYIACTSGGALGAGQIFRYRPPAAENEIAERSPSGTLELFVESSDPRQLDSCDNIVIAPWGDLLVCEDAGARCGLVGITHTGRIYALADNAWNNSELAGACFAPDGRTLFVNLQASGLTLAIDGPFPA
jgi:hypothetical protein